MRKLYCCYLILYCLPLAVLAQKANPRWSPTIQKAIAEKNAGDSVTIMVQMDAVPLSKNIRIVDRYPAASLFKLRLLRKQLLSFVSEGHVEFADIVKNPIEELTTGTLDITLNKLNLAHQQYPQINGDSIIVSIKEQQFDTTDIDYQNRVINSRNAAPNFTSHAAIMATIVAGAGNTSPFAKGAAWGATLTSATFASLLPQADSVYQRYKISIQNHSYGTAIENYYGAEAVAYDVAAVNNPNLLMVFSSGNSGTSAATSGAYAGIGGYANLTGNFKMAKNNLVVGATDSFAVVPALSSKGPTHDGRVKPELVAFGEDGSSGAAAMVSGAAALLQQAYRSRNGMLPSSALVKAALINSADDIGMPQVDYASGYGSLNAYKAVQTIATNKVLEGVVAANQTQSFPIVIPAGVQQLRVTLVWTDPAANANAAKALVNDLDAILTLPANGNAWLPWVLNPGATLAAIQQPAQRKVDTLNTVEQITIDAPDAGNYVLQIKGTRIPAGVQRFAIAYQFDTLNHFLWTSPTRNDNVIGGKTNVIRWETTRMGSGQLEYSTNGVVWIPIATIADLRRSYFQWNAPDAFAVAQLRMRFSGGAEKVSDSFAISSAPAITVGFNCKDSFLLHWRPQPVAAYQLFELGQKYLQPFATTTDTFAIISKAQHPSLYYAVAPLVQNKTGLRSFTVKYDAQGVECYFRSFFVQSQPGNRVSFTATIGSLYNVTSITFQRRIGNTYTTLKTLQAPTTLDFSFDDSGLLRGINQYRLQIQLANGSTINSEVVPVYYYPDLPVIVYPNPVAQSTPIRLLSQEPVRYTVQVFDISGRILRTMNLKDVTNAIPTYSLAKGVYFIKIISEKGVVATEKIIIY